MYQRQVAVLIVDICGLQHRENKMNKARYSKKYGVFIADKEEKIQISNMDIMTMARNICGYAVFRIAFGWTSKDNPMYKIMVNTK